MTTAEILAALDDTQSLALTAWAEARRVPRDIPSDHSPIEELIAVMVVVRNRRARFTRWRAENDSYKAICLAPAQFSCWNIGSGSNHDALMILAERLLKFPAVPVTDEVLRECLFLAQGVIADVFVDRTGHADSYYAPNAMVPPGRVPVWAAGRPKTLIGDQWFVRADLNAEPSHA